MPLPYGWGTGGLQLTCAIIGPDDVLKVIDQGADDTTNAVNIRRFIARTTGVQTTTHTTEATLIQTRHRIPETPLKAGQIMVFQVPQPEPMFRLEPRETERRRMHAMADYGLMQVRLYEDIARHGRVATTYDYPVMVENRYLMSPSPIPKFDVPKLNQSPALMLFGAGREKRIHALPPYTRVEPLDFDDFPFERVVELHVAGATKRVHEGLELYDDSHTPEPAPETWAIFEHIVARAKNLKAVVFECEKNTAEECVPGFERIVRTWGAS
jgi:alpha-D-ribose 1-methylphosphonate 5-phosphate C-P lyase